MLNDAKKSGLEARGAIVIMLPDANGTVDLASLMKDLGNRKINELHIEAGSKLNDSLIRACLVDDFLLCLAPKLLGPGQGMAAFGSLQSLADAVALQFQSVDRVGADLRIVARVVRRDQF